MACPKNPVLTDLTEKGNLPADYTLREDGQIIGIVPSVIYILDDPFDKPRGKASV